MCYDYRNIPVNMLPLKEHSRKQKISLKISLQNFTVFFFACMITSSSVFLCAVTNISYEICFKILFWKSDNSAKNVNKREMFVA